MKNVFAISFLLFLAARAALADGEGAVTNESEVADLGTIVVEGSALSRYRPETVEGATFTDLAPETTYFARVRMAEGEWSEVKSIKTQADVPTKPAWLDIPEQTAIVGQEFVLDLSAFVTGSPFPVITVNGEGTEDGNWSFTPDEAKTYTFDLVASNTEGSDAATLTVVVSEAPAAKYALCVGLNEYDYTAWAAQGWSIGPLKGCVNDATYMKKNLTERGGWADADVTLLTNETATKEAIRGAIAAVAKNAKAAGFDAIHDTVHEMAKDEARHGAGFAGLLKRYFGK